MKVVDISKWERLELYEFFARVSDPFYCVTFRQRVTKLKKYTKQHDISFYYAIVWLCTEAINSIPEFLVGRQEEKIISYDRREPSFTDINPGASHFHIVTMDAGESLDGFCQSARNTSRNQTGFIDCDKEQDNLIYFTCAPWLDITCVTNERDFNPDDSVPRIAWGKYVERDGELEVGLSVEVNHKFVDGYHIGKFHEKLSELIENLEVE